MLDDDIQDWLYLGPPKRERDQGIMSFLYEDAEDEYYDEDNYFAVIEKPRNGCIVQVQAIVFGIALCIAVVWEFRKHIFRWFGSRRRKQNVSMARHDLSSLKKIALHKMFQPSRRPSVESCSSNSRFVKLKIRPSSLPYGIVPSFNRSQASLQSSLLVNARTADGQSVHSKARLRNFPKITEICAEVSFDNSKNDLERNRETSIVRHAGGDNIKTPISKSGGKVTGDVKENGENGRHNCDGKTQSVIPMSSLRHSRPRAGKGNPIAPSTTSEDCSLNIQEASDALLKGMRISPETKCKSRGKANETSEEFQSIPEAENTQSEFQTTDLFDTKSESVRENILEKKKGREISPKSFAKPDVIPQRSPADGIKILSSKISTRKKPSDLDQISPTNEIKDAHIPATGKAINKDKGFSQKRETHKKSPCGKRGIKNINTMQDTSSQGTSKKSISRSNSQVKANELDPCSRSSYDSERSSSSSVESVSTTSVSDTTTRGTKSTSSSSPFNRKAANARKLHRKHTQFRIKHVGNFCNIVNRLRRVPGLPFYSGKQTNPKSRIGPDQQKQPVSDATITDFTWSTSRLPPVVRGATSFPNRHDPKNKRKRVYYKHNAKHRFHTSPKKVLTPISELTTPLTMSSKSNAGKNHRQLRQPDSKDVDVEVHGSASSTKMNVSPDHSENWQKDHKKFKLTRKAPDHTEIHVQPLSQDSILSSSSSLDGKDNNDQNKDSECISGLTSVSSEDNLCPEDIKSTECRRERDDHIAENPPDEFKKEIDHQDIQSKASGTLPQNRYPSAKPPRQDSSVSQRKRLLSYKNAEPTRSNTEKVSLCKIKSDDKSPIFRNKVKAARGQCKTAVACDISCSQRPPENPSLSVTYIQAPKDSTIIISSSPQSGDVNKFMGGMGDSAQTQPKRNQDRHTTPDNSSDEKAFISESRASCVSYGEVHTDKRQSGTSFKQRKETTGECRRATHRKNHPEEDGNEPREQRPLVSHGEKESHNVKGIRHFGLIRTDSGRLMAFPSGSKHGKDKHKPNPTNSSEKEPEDNGKRRKRSPHCKHVCNDDRSIHDSEHVKQTSSCSPDFCRFSGNKEKTLRERRQCHRPRGKLHTTVTHQEYMAKFPNMSAPKETFSKSSHPSLQTTEVAMSPERRLKLRRPLKGASKEPEVKLGTKRKMLDDIKKKIQSSHNKSPDRSPCKPGIKKEDQSSPEAIAKMNVLSYLGKEKNHRSTHPTNTCVEDRKFAQIRNLYGYKAHIEEAGSPDSIKSQEPRRSRSHSSSRRSLINISRASCTHSPPKSSKQTIPRHTKKPVVVTKEHEVVFEMPMMTAMHSKEKMGNQTPIDKMQPQLMQFSPDMKVPPTEKDRENTRANPRHLNIQKIKHEELHNFRNNFLYPKALESKECRLQRLSKVRETYSKMRVRKFLKDPKQRPLSKDCLVINESATNKPWYVSQNKPDNVINKEDARRLLVRPNDPDQPSENPTITQEATKVKANLATYETHGKRRISENTNFALKSSPSRATREDDTSVDVKRSSSKAHKIHVKSAPSDNNESSKTCLFVRKELSASNLNQTTEGNEMDTKLIQTKNMEEEKTQSEQQLSNMDYKQILQLLLRCGEQSGLLPSAANFSQSNMLVRPHVVCEKGEENEDTSRQSVNDTTVVLQTKPNLKRQELQIKDFQISNKPEDTNRFKSDLTMGQDAPESIYINELLKSLMQTPQEELPEALPSKIECEMDSSNISWTRNAGKKQQNSPESGKTAGNIETTTSAEEWKLKAALKNPYASDCVDAQPVNVSNFQNITANSKSNRKERHCIFKPSPSVSKDPNKLSSVTVAGGESYHEADSRKKESTHGKVTPEGNSLFTKIHGGREKPREVKPHGNDICCYHGTDDKVVVTSYRSVVSEMKNKFHVKNRSTNSSSLNDNSLGTNESSKIDELKCHASFTEDRQISAKSENSLSTTDFNLSWLDGNDSMISNSLSAKYNLSSSKEPKSRVGVSNRGRPMIVEKLSDHHPQIRENFSKHQDELIGRAQCKSKDGVIEKCGNLNKVTNCRRHSQEIAVKELSSAPRDTKKGGCTWKNHQKTANHPHKTRHDQQPRETGNYVLSAARILSSNNINAPATNNQKDGAKLKSNQETEPLVSKDQVYCQDYPLKTEYVSDNVKAVSDKVDIMTSHCDSNNSRFHVNNHQIPSKNRATRLHQALNLRAASKEGFYKINDSAVGVPKKRKMCRGNDRHCNRDFDEAKTQMFSSGKASKATAMSADANKNNAVCRLVTTNTLHCNGNLRGLNIDQLRAGASSFRHGFRKRPARPTPTNGNPAHPSTHAARRYNTPRQTPMRLNHRHQQQLLDPADHDAAANNEDTADADVPMEWYKPLSSTTAGASSAHPARAFRNKRNHKQ